MNTSPNQKVVNVHRVALGGNFLGINNDNWKYASRVLGAQAFLLYIYFVSNKDNYKLALSPKAIQKEIGMPPSTYRDQIHKLESLGFLKQGKGNVYHFYEVPQHDTHFQNADDALNCSEGKNTTFVDTSTAHVSETPPEDIEIYKENINKSTNSPRVDGNAVPMGKEEFFKKYVF